MKIITAPQGSEEWYAARLGHPTASQFHRIISPKTMKPMAEGRRYKCELLYERLYKKPFERMKRPTQAMLDGTQREPEAANQFTLDTGLALDRIGHITDDAGRWGTSPDRIVRGHNHCVEIKCPEEQTHIRYVVFGADEDYRCQVHGHLLIGGFEVCHFYSYHPDFDSVHLPFGRDLKFMAELMRLLTEFADELDQHEKLVRRGFLLDRIAELPSAFPEADAEEAA